MNLGKPRQPQAYYAEYQCTGPGPTPKPASLVHQLTAAQSRQYMPRIFTAGPDHWNPEAEARNLP